VLYHHLSRFLNAGAVPAIAICCLFVAGCSGGRSYELAPVSGKVTLGGQPVENVQVSFQPKSGGAGVEAGPGSIGVTGPDGTFQLKTVAQISEEGAVVGQHTVFLMESSGGGGEEDDSGEDIQYTLPEEARDGSLTSDVPAEGTDQANFEF
jgi:hypothetical protein